ncbi:MAG: aspartate kinase [Ruminococcaceae bacterium]|nr:aspartate kinase [Oscillospiraceae bacterium]MBQ2781237.1 aspartate kinase [Clostridia bacterium]
MLVVQKFGGSSVRDTERLLNVARIVTDTYKQGNEVVVVVSAQGDTTDDLIAKAKELGKKNSKREMDMLMAAGEQISIALLAMAIESLGCPATSLLGWQAGFVTNSTYGAARIKRVNAERIRTELDKNRIVVVAGFQGLNRNEDVTTLGRGGSDTSAVAIAASMHADLCQIYTDVEGVYTADPRKIPNARKLSEITYGEMLELASLGAQVLNNRSVEMAQKYNVELEVLSSLNRVPGTRVMEVAKMEKMLIKGVAKDTSVGRVMVVGLPDEPGIAFKVFSLVARAHVNVDIILQSVGRDGTKDITFTVPAEDGADAVEALKDFCERMGAKDLRYDTECAKVSIVGAGMETHEGVAAKMFEALADADINIEMISTSEIKISVLIALADADRAVAAVHKAFFETND